MKKILSFLWGAFTASLIWMLIVRDNFSEDVIGTIIMIFIVNAIVIVAIFANYIIESWDTFD